MFPIWLFVGSVAIVMGIFNKPLLRALGLKPMSEVFTTPNLRHSSKIIEQIGRWLAITLGVSFLIQGLGELLPNDVGSKVAAVLLGISGLLLLVMFGIAIVNWRAR